MKILLIAVIGLAATPASASTFRCDARLSPGAVYQDQPCPGGTFQRQQRLVTPGPPELFKVPAKEEIIARPPVRVVPIEDAAGSRAER